MSWIRHRTLELTALVLVAALAASCGFRRKKYENPIDADTQQPDKVLYDKAIHDIEHGRFEVARLTLNTLINTYDTSEFLAKAKLAVADSWFREGGAHGLAQAEAEYKDFILFYPTMEEAAESQEKICAIHFKQMDKPDRDQNHALRAEAECRQLLLQFPNSKFAPVAEQRLREIQEVLADGDFRVGAFYHNKGSNAAASNRLGSVVNQYPLYSKADEALWYEADAYSKMGPRFRNQAIEAYSRIVKDYPLSAYADQAKKMLTSLEAPIPDPDPVALARMKYEQENRSSPGLFYRLTGFIRSAPDVHMAAKSGQPAMTNIKPTVPASVPPVAGTPGFTGDVTATTLTDSSALDTRPDARMNPPTAADSKTASGSASQPAASGASGQSTQAQPASSSSGQQEPQASNTKGKKAKKNKKQKKTRTPPPAAPQPQSTQ